MYPANIDHLPSPLSSLGSLLEDGDTSEKPMKVFIGHNLGYRTFMMQIPMHEFFEMSEVANDPGQDPNLIAQRKLDPSHAHKLATYILKGLVSSVIKKYTIDGKDIPEAFETIQNTLGKQPYLSLQPIVVNIRECSPQGENIRGLRMTTSDSETAAFKIFLSQKHVLWVIDGQHRRKGLDLVFDFLETLRSKPTYPKKGSLYPNPGKDLEKEEILLWEECFSIARGFCTIAVEVHLGLSIDQERQLFHDLNRLGKKVDTSLALHFDSSNAVNMFIKEELIEKMGLKISESDQKDWHTDTGALSRKEITVINAILFLNKSNISGATPATVTPKQEVAYSFWETIMQIPGVGEEKAKEITVAAQPVVLKALAKIVYDLSFSNRRPSNSDELLNKFIDHITEVDFSHENPIWNYYNMTQDEIEKNNLQDLKNWLPEDNDSVNRDIGSMQGPYMRFGAKHNDIYPIIGDMIRWQLGLPSRHIRKAS